jgi:hypothetical protein
MNKTEAIPRARNIKSTITGDTFSRCGKSYKILMEAQILPLEETLYYKAARSLNNLSAIYLY